MTHNGAGALCSASLEEFKDISGPITMDDARKDLLALKPFWGKFKDSQTGTSDHREQPFLGAHQVESVDPRLAEYDGDGKLISVRYANMTALLVAGYQEQQREINHLWIALETIGILCAATIGNLYRRRS